MKTVLCELPEEISRMETGPVQFGDDWPGFFLRGDDAARLVMLASEGAKVLIKEGRMVEGVQLQAWVNHLSECRVGSEDA